MEITEGQTPKKQKKQKNTDLPVTEWGGIKNRLNPEL